MRVEIPNQRKVLEHYGADAQAMIHCEELSELIQMVSKARRAVKNGQSIPSEVYNNLVGEYADVLICLEQIKEMYLIPDSSIQVMVDYKCRRQEDRMNGTA